MFFNGKSPYHAVREEYVLKQLGGGKDIEIISIVPGSVTKQLFKDIDEMRVTYRKKGKLYETKMIFPKSEITRV